MLILEDQPLCLETILAAVRPRLCDSSDRRAVVRALERFDSFEATRRKARAIRTAPEAEDELGELGVKLHPMLRERALEQFHPEAVRELQDVLWAENTRRLEDEVGPVLRKANLRTAERLEKAAADLRSAQAKIVEPFGLKAEASSAERELKSAAGWFREASARPLNLSSQSDPRRCLSEGFAEAL